MQNTCFESLGRQHGVEVKSSTPCCSKESVSFQRTWRTCAKKACNECYYRNCKANELFAAILLHSSFGNALLEIGSENVCSELEKPTVRLQRFFYKLCELRKVNNARRGVYYKTFKTPEARKEWLQKHHNEGAAVVKPIW